MAAVAGHSALAQTLPAAPAEGPSLTSPKPAGEPSDMEARAKAFVRAFNEGVSGTDDLAVRTISTAYAGITDFYGASRTAEEIAKEKTAIFRRWPVRSYLAPESEMSARCDEALRRCEVVSMVHWSVSSPQRQAQSSGTSRMDMTIGFSDLGPQILRETGETVSRN